jgi:hypothetical protein
MSHRDDPQWQDAQRRYVADMAPAETAPEAMARRLIAARDMYRAEAGQEREEAGAA